MNEKELLELAKGMLEIESKSPGTISKSMDKLAKAIPVRHPASAVQDQVWHGSGHGTHQLGKPVAGIHEMKVGGVYPTHDTKFRAKNMFRVTGNDGKVVSGHFVNPENFDQKRLPDDRTHAYHDFMINQKGSHNIFHHLSQNPASAAASSSPAKRAIGKAEECEKCGMEKSMCKCMAKAGNPDEKADAQLGEDVEHLVEDHMIANAPAEREEGHKIDIRKDVMSEWKPRFMKKAAAGGAYGGADMGYLGKDDQESVEQEMSPDRPSYENSMSMSEMCKADLAKDWKPRFLKKDIVAAEPSMEKEEKGVHQPWGEKGNKLRGSGSSLAGIAARQKHQWANQEHRRVHKELKEMPAPKLPKAEMEKNQKVNPGKGSYVNRFDEQKGVHKPVVGLPGHSRAGGGWGGKEPSERHSHKRVLHELRSMPAPKLPKAEMEKEEPAPREAVAIKRLKAGKNKQHYSVGGHEVHATRMKDPRGHWAIAHKKTGQDIGYGTTLRGALADAHNTLKMHGQIKKQELGKEAGKAKAGKK
jgi:hypothetical protein